MRRLFEIETPRQPPPQLWFALIRLVQWARLLMMDFGFQSFLDKFEERFGSIPTFVLLILIALAIAAFCLNILFTLAIIPLYQSINEIINQGQVNLSSAWDLLKSIGSVLLFVFVAVSLVNALETSRSAKDSLDTVEKAKGGLGEARAMLSAAASCLQLSKEHLQDIETVKDIVDQIPLIADRSKDPDTAAELRALVDSLRAERIKIDAKVESLSPLSPQDTE